MICEITGKTAIEIVNTLIKEGFIQRTSRGRVAQERAFKLLGRTSKTQQGIFND